MTKIFSVALFYRSMQEKGMSHEEIQKYIDDWAYKCDGKKIDKNGFVKGTPFISHEKWEKTV